MTAERWMMRLVLVSATALAWGCAPQPAEPAAPTPPARSAESEQMGIGVQGAPAVKIGFLVKQPDEAWFQDEWKFAKQCGTDHGFEVITNGSADGAKILQLIDTLATQGAQGFVICTPDVRLGPAIVSRAKEHNMKVYSVDDRFVGSDGKFMEDVPYMGISASDIGRTVGKALADEWRKQGWPLEETAAAGITFDELDTARQRTDGAKEALIEAGLPADRIFTQNERRPDVPAAQDAMSTLLTQHGEIKHWLVFSMNDEGVLGAARALESRGFSPQDCSGIGIGGSSSLPELESSKPSIFKGTVLISAKQHGYDTTLGLFKWITQGQAPPPEILTKGHLVDRSNFREIAKQIGVM